jgi:hypothetical protein
MPFAEDQDMIQGSRAELSRSGAQRMDSADGEIVVISGGPESPSAIRTDSRAHIKNETPKRAR